MVQLQKLDKEHPTARGIWLSAWGRRGSVCWRSGAHRDIKLKIGFVNNKKHPPRLLCYGGVSTPPYSFIANSRKRIASSLPERPPSASRTASRETPSARASAAIAPYGTRIFLLFICIFYIFLIYLYLKRGYICRRDCFASKGKAMLSNVQAFCFYFTSNAFI